MPFEIVNKEWLEPFRENVKALLEEYEQFEKEGFNIDHPYYHPLWNILFMKDAFDGVHDNLKKLPVLKKMIENIPENIYLVLSMYSVISPGMIGHFHSEPYPREKGYRRYHIPLRVPEGVRFEIEGEPLYEWKVGNVYEFLNPGTMHRIVYPEGNQDRVIFLIDVFEDYVPNQEELNHCYNIGGRFLDKSNK